jgi:hypothetical protein
MSESTIVFDTLSFAKKLKSAGFTEQQAEIQAEALAEIIENNLATKRDLKELETRLMTSIAEIKADMIKWVAGMLVAQAALVAALVKLL